MAVLATAACPAVTACPVVAGPTARCQADPRASASRTVGTQMAACPTGRRCTALPRTAACRTALPRTAACRTVHLRTVHLRTVHLRTVHLRTGYLRTVACRMVACRMVACRMVACRMAGSRRAPPCQTAPRCPVAGRYPAGSPGCRTGAGCRRTRTALTGRLGPAHRAGHRVDTTGRARPPPTRTPTVGAARTRRQAHHRPVPSCQAVQGPEDRPRVRLTGVRSPITHRGYLGKLAYLGYLGNLGLRRCVSTRPRGRASTRLTAASGSGHRRGRRWNRRGR